MAKAEPLAEDAEKLATLIEPVVGDFNEMVIIPDGPHITIKGRPQLRLRPCRVRLALFIPPAFS